MSIRRNVQFKDPELTRLFAVFDKAVVTHLGIVSANLNAACARVERKVNDLAEVVRKLQEKCAETIEAHSLHCAQQIARERFHKMITCQWANRQAVKVDNLDALSFAFTRFALNVAFAAGSVPADLILKTNVHVLLVSMLAVESEFIIGPAAFALAHLSLEPRMRADLVTAGVLPKALQVLQKRPSEAVLVAVCKLLASLTLLPANRAKFAESGMIGALVKLITPTPNRRRVGNAVMEYVAKAIGNGAYASHSNKSIVVDLDGPSLLLSAINYYQDDNALAASVQALANVAYFHDLAGNRALSAHADQILSDCIECTDILSEKQAPLVEACLWAFANLCTTPLVQTQIGSSKALSLIHRVLRITESTVLLEAAVAALNALSFNHMPNRAKVASEDCLQLLYDRLVRHLFDAPHQSCVFRISNLLASLMLYEPNQHRFIALGAVDKISEILQADTRTWVLDSLSRIFCALTPSHEDRVRFEREDAVIPMIYVNALSALERTKLWAYSDRTAPRWLERAIAVLSGDASKQPPNTTAPIEAITAAEIFKETEMPIAPDLVVFSRPEIRGLVTSLC